jgi:hypothetical protein
MGYLGFFFVKAKTFEILSEVGNGGIRLAERSKGVYRAVILGKFSVIWLLNMVEELIIKE